EGGGSAARATAVTASATASAAGADLMPALVLVREDRHARDRARAAEVVREPDARPVDLTLAGAPAQLGRELVGHPDAGRADRMPVRLQPTGGIDGLLASERGAAVLDEPPALSPCAEPEILVVQDLGDGEAVVHLGEVDLGRPDPRLRVRLLGRAHRRLEA